MAHTIDLVICDPSPRELVDAFSRVGIRVAVTGDYYSLFTSVNEQHPRLIAGALLEDSRTLEDFCAIFKSENLRIPLVFYGDACAENLRLPLVELGADDVVERPDLIPAVVQMLRQVSERDAESTSVTVLPKSPAESRYTCFLPFEGNDLSHVLQFIALSRRTGVLEVNFDDENAGTGKVYTGDARIVHVEYGGREGLDALSDMMRRGAGKAGLVPDVNAPRISIHLPLDHVIIEASVMADEVDR